MFFSRRGSALKYVDHLATPYTWVNDFDMYMSEDRRAGYKIAHRAVNNSRGYSQGQEFSMLVDIPGNKRRAARISRQLLTGLRRTCVDFVEGTAYQVTEERLGIRIWFRSQRVPSTARDNA